MTTFFGSGNYGYVDGVSTVAQFRSPTGIAVDSTGNVYVADPGNNVIRKIDPFGTVSTLAGSGSAGHADGSGSAASFSAPAGVAADAAGNVYVADEGNNVIRMVTPSGKVTTVAGSGFPGSADGPAPQASFYGPSDVKLDSQGNLYVAQSNMIRKISTAGIVTTLPMGGNGGLGIDSKGNIYAVVPNSIEKLAPGGEAISFAGGYYGGNTNGVGNYASFFWPNKIAIDNSDNIYVSEAPYEGFPMSHDIRVITPLGRVETYAGSGAPGSTDGPGTAATFMRPAGMAFDAAGNLYVADSSANVIRKIKRVQ